ncbi:MAG: amidohydrolase family protein, partial [Terracidiphilus sp.]
MMLNRFTVQRRLAVLMVFMLSACSNAWAKEASVILINGKVWTVNPAQPVAQAVALDGNTILAVGSDAEIRKLAGPGTRTIDLAGRLLLPGFNDSHVHFLPGGGSLIAVQLRDSTSQGDFRDRIARYAKTLPTGAWIRGGTWDHQSWNPPVLPDRQLIDAASDGHPAFLQRIDGHMALANSLALKLAGIGRDTPNPPGGEIDRDNHGNP